uniref:Uncharacterized protein n=1 Tax=Caenorhabditis tropicalis TaxID=1561998 RepID=A0A1I7U7I8_9PELO
MIDTPTNNTITTSTTPLRHKHRLTEDRPFFFSSFSAHLNEEKDESNGVLRSVGDEEGGKIEEGANEECANRTFTTLVIPICRLESYFHE